MPALTLMLPVLAKPPRYQAGPSGVEAQTMVVLRWEVVLSPEGSTAFRKLRDICNGDLWLGTHGDTVRHGADFTRPQLGHRQECWRPLRITEQGKVKLNVGRDRIELVLGEAKVGACLFMQFSSTRFCRPIVVSRHKHGERVAARQRIVGRVLCEMLDSELGRICAQSFAKIAAASVARAWVE